MMTLLAFDFHRDTLSDDVDHKLSHDTPTLRASVTPSAEAIGGDDAPEARVVKVCKSCMRSAPDEAEFCPDCGEDLVSIRRVPDMYLDEVVGGKYRIVEKVGQGGMGVVYLARNDELGQKVAVKFLSKKFADDENLVLRFLNEAKSYCRVNHPNAVTLLDYGQHDDGALFIITEFVEGMNVTETLKERGPLPSDGVLDLGIQMAEVLSAAHSQGVIHRDLKPDNIMLMPLARGRYAVKVLDFGIAKIVDEEDGPNTETGSVFGTPEFMSPEQARGDEADGRSDIYALGVILFYMVTGKLPFRGKNKLVVLNMQLNDPAPRPRDVNENADIDARFESVVMKCLNKGRDQRYDSADDLLEALEDLRVPGGQATGKVGNLRETAPTPVMRSSDGDGDWDEIDAHDDTLASIENRPAVWELESIEMGREANARRPALPADRGPGLAPIIILLGLAILGGLAWITFGGGGDADPAPASEGPATPVASEESPERPIVNHSQTDALVVSVNGMIEDGKLDEARAALDYSKVADAEATRDLGRRLTDLERVRLEFDTAIAAKNCEKAGEVSHDIESAGLRRQFEEAIGACEAARAQAARPAPKPDKPVVKQREEHHTVTTPEPDPPEVEPDATPEETKTLPDDMALPPKTLDE